MISRRSKFNLLNEIVFCPRLLQFDPWGPREVGEGLGRPRCEAGGGARWCGKREAVQALEEQAAPS